MACYECTLTKQTVVYSVRGMTLSVRGWTLFIRGWTLSVRGRSLQQIDPRI